MPSWFAETLSMQTISWEPQMPRATETESSGSTVQKHQAWGEESKDKLENTVTFLSVVWGANTPPLAACLLGIRSGNSTLHIIMESQHNTRGLSAQRKAQHRIFTFPSEEFLLANHVHGTNHLLHGLELTPWELVLSSHPCLLNLLSFREVILTCGRAA